MQPSLPPGLEKFRTELATYYRELPRLLDERHEGKYVAIKGEELFGTWDTFHDVRQFASLRSEEGPFLTQKIDARFLTLLKPHFGSTAGGNGVPLPVAEVA